MTDVNKQLRDLAEGEAAVDERLKALAKDSETRVLRDPRIYARDRRAVPGGGDAVKPATHAHLATRLDLLEQKFDQMEPSEGGGGDGVTRAEFERLFDRVLGWSYTGPHDEEVIKGTPSENRTVYDFYPGYGNLSLHRSIFGSPQMEASLKRPTISPIR